MDHRPQTALLVSANRSGLVGGALDRVALPQCAADVLVGWSVGPKRLCSPHRAGGGALSSKSFGVSLADLASLATAAGVVLVVIQLVLGRLQTRTALEDDPAREYRTSLRHFPLPCSSTRRTLVTRYLRSASVSSSTSAISIFRTSKALVPHFSWAISPLRRERVSALVRGRRGAAEGRRRSGCARRPEPGRGSLGVPSSSIALRHCLAVFGTVDTGHLLASGDLQLAGACNGATSAKTDCGRLRTSSSNVELAVQDFAARASVGGASKSSALASATCSTPGATRTILIGQPLRGCSLSESPAHAAAVRRRAAGRSRPRRRCDRWCR